MIIGIARLVDNMDIKFLIDGKEERNISGILPTEGSIVELKKDGSSWSGLVPYAGTTGSNYNHIAASGAVSLSVGQYISFFCGAVISGATGGRHNGFSVHLIGPN